MFTSHQRCCGTGCAGIQLRGVLPSSDQPCPGEPFVRQQKWGIHLSHRRLQRECDISSEKCTDTGLWFQEQYFTTVCSRLHLHNSIGWKGDWCVIKNNKTRKKTFFSLKVCPSNKRIVSPDLLVWRDLCSGYTYLAGSLEEFQWNRECCATCMATVPHHLEDSCV